MGSAIPKSIVTSVEIERLYRDAPCVAPDARSDNSSRIGCWPLLRIAMRICPVASTSSKHYCQVPEIRGNFFSTSRAKRITPIGDASSLKS